MFYLSVNILRTYVRLTARHAIHLQFDISANAIKVRAVQSPKCSLISILAILKQA
jgi:hypothetical protein